MRQGSVTLSEVTDATFADTVLASDRLVVVDFWAPWCPACPRLSATLAVLADELGDRISAVVMNYDDNPRTGQAYRVMSLPTLLVFRGGEVVGSVVGARPLSYLRQAILAQLDR